MASCATLQTWLTEAETALHKVQTGQKVEVTQYGTKSITYSRVNVGDLQRYVLELRDQVAACSGTSRNRRHYIGVIPS